MMLTASSTLWSQDSVKVAYSDLKEILILASKGEKMDTLIYHFELQLEIKDSKIELREEQLQLAQELISKQSIVIADLQAKLSESERKRLNLKRGAIALFGVIGIETFFLILK